MVLSNERLDYILSEIRKIKHIKIIRLGTRVPVYLPQRITQDKELIKILCKYNFPDKQIYFVTHFNHPNEITNEATKAIKTLINNGIQVKNQTVLLKDVNDNPEILAKLFNNLFYIGIAPYYLFQCRPVIRSSHFRVPIDKGWKIFEKAKKKMSGLAKTARYTMSHATGKIEICGIVDDKIYLKYIQAKNYEDIGRFFIKKLPKNKEAYWFDDLLEFHK